MTNFRLFQSEDNNFKFDKNGREKTLQEKEKLLVTSNFSFSHNIFKRLVLQTCKNQGLFGKGLMTLEETFKSFTRQQNCSPVQLQSICKSCEGKGSNTEGKETRGP